MFGTGGLVVSLEQFISGLTASGLMTAEEVHAFLVSLPPTPDAPSTRLLAAELLRRERLTKYQVSRIAQGQTNGLVLGKYVIQDKIGQGGMGEVFIAEHRRMKRPVVVKLLPPEATKSQEAILRFEREVEAAAQLSHPNIVTAFDADEEGGLHFLVMEYVDGEPLGELLSRVGPLPIKLAVSCGVQAARGLEYAHAKGIIHRDIKPNNLLLDKAGIVKILDMGLARFDDGRGTVAAAEEGLTRQNQIMGTVEYMSPEQVDDSAHVDRRSDVYSLGCTMFRLITQQPPYQGATFIETLLAHRSKPIPSIQQHRPDVPASLDRIVQRMMAKRPEQRYQSMSDALHDLLACAQEVGVSTTAPGMHASQGPKESEAEAMEEPATELMERSPELSRSEDGSTMALEATDVLASRRSLAVGIDLGTTFSALAYLDETDRPKVVSNQEGDKTTPSVVLVEEHGVVVGKEAVKAMGTDMESIAECAKRDLGQHAFHRAVGGQQFPPEVIQAWILNKLHVDAQQSLGPFRQAVITVPAYFDEVRRKATQDAGYIAGLDVLDIINEPTAAALAFGYQRGQLDADDSSEAPLRVLVYDLGGGTFDVTIMEIAAGEFVTLATDGDVRLGGRDWDQRLLDYVAETFIRQHGLDPREDPNTYGRLLRECEDAKRTLSARRKASVVCEYQGRAERIEVTRDVFEEITHDLLERTAFTTRQTLQSAGLDWSDINHVLAVGGSTRMPAVVNLLTGMSGKKPDVTVSPDEAVALGAAIHAGLVLDRLAGRNPLVRVRNVNSHSLGVVGTDPKTHRKQTAILIPRNSPLPAKAKRTFKTLKAGQRSIVTSIVEGESTEPEECNQIGQFRVRDLPENLPAGTPVEVRFQYEENGRLQVAVHVVGICEPVSHEITRTNNLRETQLSRWRAKVAGPEAPAVAN